MRQNRQTGIINIPSTEQMFTLHKVDNNFAITDGALQLPMLDCPKRTNESALYFCKAGNATLKIDSREYTLQPDSVMAIFPDQIIETVEKSDNFSAWMVFMSHSFVNDIQTKMCCRLPLFYRFKKQQYITLTQEDTIIIEGMFRLINDKIKNIFNKNKRDALLLFASACFMETGELIDKYTGLIDIYYKNSNLEIYCKFMKLLDDNYLKEHSMKFYADKLQLTQRHMSSSIKAVCNRTAHECLEEKIINVAKNMLRTTDKSVRQISKELSFKEPNNFSLFFKKNAGISPGMFRNM
jgi:AraC-like DNA-binding protein